MKKDKAFLGKGWVFILGVLLLTLSCGDINQAPFGSTITMPEDTTYTSAGDMVFITKAVVVDKDNNPLNNVDVEFMVCCDGVEIIDDLGGSLGNDVTIKTDNAGVATANILVYGNFEGEITVSADIGTVSAQTKITKAVPAAI